MSRGVLLFAFNSDTVDYYKMAVATAKRVNQYLNLPVTVITDESTDITQYDYKFDNVIIQVPNKDNKTIEDNVWINKGRYSAYDLTPYDETLVLDTDYLINSDTLLKPFELYDDFMCHNRTSFLMKADVPQEQLGDHAVNALWATVMYFKKTTKTKQIFECMKMVQDNYSHYMRLYNMTVPMYRNDFALTIAVRIVYGQTTDVSVYIPWNLVHVGTGTIVSRINDDSYTITYDNWKQHKIRKEYITVTGSDFHMMNKKNFMELI
jgi:hypothetical protein